MKIRTYTYSDLVRKAQEIYESAPGIFLSSPPVDIELYIEREVGIELREIPGLRRQYGIWGLFAATADLSARMIAFDYELLSDHCLGLYRFTLAEELAHSILHADLLRGVASPEDFLDRLQTPTDGPYDCVERNAKLLGSFLLMPSPLLLEPAADVLRSFPPAAQQLQAAPLLGKVKDPMAAQFEVSPESMFYRLKGELEIEKLVRKYQEGRL